jgi:hypothetical protein
MQRIIGIILVAGGFSIAYHSVNTLRGWQHRNKVELAIPDYAPYFELIAGIGVLMLGIWLLIRRKSGTSR